MGTDSKLRLWTSAWPIANRPSREASISESAVDLKSEHGAGSMGRGIFSVLLGANLLASAQSDMPKPAYDLSLPREERIKLAESAAPPEISSHATVYLLEQTG